MRNIILLLIALAILVILLNSLTADPYSKLGNPPRQYYSDSLPFDSVNVRFVGNWPFGRPYHVAYDSLRNIVFLSSGAGVYILDISDPSNPVKISESIHSREFIHWELFYDSNMQRLYVGVARWFEIWDVSNPVLPTMLGSFATSGPDYTDGSICASDSYAYCVDDSCFSIVDVSIPSNPQIVGGLPLGGRSIAVKDSFVYILSAGAIGFRVIDISDPQNPELVSFLGQKGCDIAIFGSRAYVSSNLQGLKFRIIDISDPYNPQFCGYFDSPDDVYHAHVIDTIAYLATDLGLRMVNIADPMNPQEIGYFFCRGRDIFVKDTLSFIVDRDTGLRVFDISSPSSPLEVGQFITPGKSFNAQVSGAFTYIANERGLWIIDVSDPANSAERGRCYTPCKIYDVRISGSFAYAADRDSGLIVFDISDPYNPYIVSILNLPGWFWASPKGLDVSGQYAYVADGYNGLRIVNISNPSFPYEVAQCSIMDVIDVDISGLYAYVVSIYLFTVVDISNPSNPVIASSIDDLYCPSDICISGMYAFVTDTTHSTANGLYTFSISDPYNPYKIYGDPMYRPTGVDISGLYAYVSRDDAALIIFDISQPANPTFAGFYHSFCYDFWFNGIFALGSYAYISTDCGLQIYQFYGAGVEEEPQEVFVIQSSIKLLQNPITGNSIKIMLTTNKSSNINIGLYNILGQEVKTFNLENLCVGKNHIDLSVDQIPGGIYFLRLQGKECTQSEKIVILK